MMETILQGLVGLSCLFLAGLGTKTMFAPKSMAGILNVEPETPAGLSTVRGNIGGLFVGCSIVLATGLVTSNKTLFLAVAMIMSVVVVGRLVGIAVDGFDKKVLIPLVAEVIMFSIFIGAYTQLGPV